MKTIVSLILCSIIFTSQAQNVSLDWVKTFGGSATETSKILKNDSEDNLYIIGRFYGTVDFDPGPGIANRTSNGGLDVYIIKLNSSGSFQWVQSFGNASHDDVVYARVDKMDNIVLTGQFVNSIDFDPSTNVDIKTSNGLSDAYILKLDGAGNYLWAKNIGGPLHDRARGLSINSTNDITIAGAFVGTVDFDPGPGVANETALSVDIYILQLNAAGNFNWIKTLKGPQISAVQVHDIMYDKNDNLLMSAHYADSIDVDPGPGTHYIVDTADKTQSNLLILKLDPMGNFVWAKQFENTNGNNVGISYLSLDSVGNYYIGGFFMGNVDFDFGTAAFNITTPQNASYILKIDSNGNFIWAKHMGGFSGIGGPEYETVTGIAIDVQGNVTLSGCFVGYEDFDPGPAVFYLGSQNNLTHIHGYIMQLDNTGSLSWAKYFGDLPPNAAAAHGVLLNHQDNLYVTGEFIDNTDFDFNAGVHNVMPVGNWDAFVLKINNCVNSSTTDVVSSCSPITWIDGNTYSTSNFTAKDTLNSVGGCDSVVTLNLTITNIDTSINKSGNTLTANAAGVTYQWVNCDNNFTSIPGETNQSFTPNINGSYAVVLNNGSCSDTSLCYTFMALASNDIITNNISIFPNPTNGLVQIRTDKQLTLRLYNNIGQLIIVKEINNTQTGNTIALNKFSKGLYIYELSHKSQVVSRGKLILE